MVADREMIDKFIWFFDEARCAVGKSTKQRWVDNIKTALDLWLERQ